MIRPSAVALPLLALAVAPAAAGEELAPGEYEIAEGLAVSSAVAPGLVRHPVAAAFDDRGRLFVAESNGENLRREELEEQLPHFVQMLEDTDGDGVFDRATLFAENMTFPQGVLWVYDSLYVASPPSIWRLADESGDGRADTAEELVTGFGYTGNAADVHGPHLHPNGRLYWAHGRKEFAVHDPATGELVAEGRGARIWSSRIDGSDVESFAGGGMDNPVEIDFTDEGEILGSVNLFHGRPRSDTLVHFVLGGVYPRYDQGEVLAEFRRTGDLLTAVHDYGHEAVSGMCRYRSGMLDPEWRDQWMVSHFNNSKITRTKTRRLGASFAEVETETIFRILRPDSHLTDVLEDPNGDLLVVDTGGWFRIGCPTSQIAKPEVAGGIYRISRADAGPYRAPVRPQWDRLTEAQAAALLASGDHWVQERAMTELAVRGQAALPELEELLLAPGSPEQVRRNAVWTLARMRFSDAADLLGEALEDPDPGVRQAACNALGVTRSWRLISANHPEEREIEMERNRIFAGPLLSLVREDAPPVAREAAAALGLMKERRAVPVLAERLSRAGEDAFLRHALVHALISIDDFEATRAELEDADPAVTAGVLYALDQMPSSRLEALDALRFLESEDPLLRAAVVDIARGRPEWDAALANRFYDWGEDPSPDQAALLEELLPPFLDSPPMLAYLTGLLGSGRETLRDLSLRLVAATPPSEFPEEWTPVLSTLLSGGGGDHARDLALDAIARTGSEHFEEELQSLSADESLPRLTRVRAARAQAAGEGALPDESFALLVAILEEEEDFETRSDAIAILSAATLRPPQRTALAGVLSGFSPVEMSALLDLFRRVDDEEQAELVLAAVLDSPAFPNLEFVRLRRLFESFEDTSFVERVDRRAEQEEEERAARRERIDAILAMVPEADPGRGREHFSLGKGSCKVCHRIEGEGGEVGPDLSSVGRIRNARDLVEAVIFPNESISRDFEAYEVRLADPPGGARLGLIDKRTPASIELIDPAGQRHRIDRGEIESIVQLPVSLMPAGLDQTMEPGELADLIAYLLKLE